MNQSIPKTLVLGLALAMAPVAASFAQSGSDVFAEYREMFGDDNPAELAEMQGEETWRAVRGPKQASLEQCDLGLGPGVLQGAYAQLPRWFEDAGQVMDLEMRLLWCMEKQQGLDVSALRAHPFSEQGQQQTDLEALSAFRPGFGGSLPSSSSRPSLAEAAAAFAFQAPLGVGRRRRSP